MSFLLDTNVVSEWVKLRPDRGLVAWLAAVDESRVFLSTVTLAELRYGIECMAHGRRRQRLEKWLTDDLRPRFEGRILAIDERVADHWGRIAARGRAVGRPGRTMDGFIAATAVAHDLTLVTRNVADFQSTGVATFNPWSR